MADKNIARAEPSYTPKHGNNGTVQTSSPDRRAPGTTPSPHTPPRGQFQLSPSHPLNLTRSTPHRTTNQHHYPRSRQLHISPRSDVPLILSDDDMRVDLGWEPPLRLSPPTALPYTNPELHLRATINPFTGPAYTGASRASKSEHQQTATPPRLFPDHLGYQQDPNSGFGRSSNQPGPRTHPDRQLHLDRHTHGVCEQSWNPAPRLGANEPSSVPSSIAHTLPTLQANLDHHTRSVSAGHLSPPRRRYISSAIPVGRPHAFLNPGSSLGRPHPLDSIPTGTPTRAPAHQTPMPARRPHRNRGAQPPHANREFFYYWLRKHDVVQVLAGPQRLLTESALVRLHGMGKQVLDVYELSGREWEELGVSKIVGQRLRRAVVEFTREKSMVLEEFMQKGERDGWFMPFETNGV